MNDIPKIEAAWDDLPSTYEEAAGDYCDARPSECGGW